MFKKFALLFFSMIIFSSCTSVPLKPFYYSGENQTFPMVYYAMKNVLPERHRFSEISIYNDYFVIPDILVMDGIVFAHFDMIIEFKDGEATYSAQNIYYKNGKVWNKVNSFLLYNPNEIFASFSRAMEIVATNLELYEEYKNMALCDIYFLHPAVKNLNEIARNDFYETELKDRYFNFIAKVIDVKENDFMGYEDYKYKIICDVELREDEDIQYMLTNNYFNIQYLTNFNDVKKYNPGSQISVEGYMASFKKLSIAGDNFSFILVNSKK